MAKAKSTDAAPQVTADGGEQTGDYRIVVLQRGWVFFGKFRRDGEECILTGAHCIRVWGTTKGLGELRAKPLAGTKLDAAGEVRYHQLTEVFSLAVSAKGWASVCGR